MQNCPYCDSQIADDNQVFIAEKIEAAGLFWHQAESDDSRYGMPIGKRISLGDDLVAEVVAKKVKVDFSEMQHGYWEDGSLPQGTTFETYVVLKVGEHFFKKTGEGDSYSEITWTGPVRPVKAKQKQVTVYEF